jgi:hypothetical protein
VAQGASTIAGRDTDPPPPKGGRCHVKEDVLPWPRARTRARRGAVAVTRVSVRRLQVGANTLTLYTDLHALALSVYWFLFFFISATCCRLEDSGSIWIIFLLPRLFPTCAALENHLCPQIAKDVLTMASAKFWAPTLGENPCEEHEAEKELCAGTEANPTSPPLHRTSAHPGQGSVQSTPVLPSFQIGFPMAYEVRSIQHTVCSLTCLHC